MHTDQGGNTSQSATSTLCVLSDELVTGQASWGPPWRSSSGKGPTGAEPTITELNVALIIASETPQETGHQARVDLGVAGGWALLTGQLLSPLPCASLAPLSPSIFSQRPQGCYIFTGLGLWAWVLEMEPSVLHKLGAGF